MSRGSWEHRVAMPICGRGGPIWYIAASEGGHVRTKLTARFVIGYADGDHAIYPQGAVVYEGDAIIFVGHDFPGPVDVVQDFGDAIISPGFIDLDALGDIDHAILDTWLTPDRAAG